MKNNIVDRTCDIFDEVTKKNSPNNNNNNH